MNPLTRIQFLGFAAAGALVVLAVASIPAGANELAQSLGPVGPHTPILTTVGSKRLVAFYVPNDGHCAVNAVVWEKTDVAADSVARFRISLKPRQVVHLDSVDASLTLQCGDRAETLAIVEARESVAAGAAE